MFPNFGCSHCNDNLLITATNFSMSQKKKKKTTLTTHHPQYCKVVKASSSLFPKTIIAIFGTYPQTTTSNKLAPTSIAGLCMCHTRKNKPTTWKVTIIGVSAGDQHKRSRKRQALNQDSKSPSRLPSLGFPCRSKKTQGTPWGWYTRMALKDGTSWRSTIIPMVTGQAVLLWHTLPVTNRQNTGLLRTTKRLFDLFAPAGIYSEHMLARGSNMPSDSLSVPTTRLQTGQSFLGLLFQIAWRQMGTGTREEAKTQEKRKKKPIQSFVGMGSKKLV